MEWKVSMSVCVLVCAGVLFQEYYYWVLMARMIRKTQQNSEPVEESQWRRFWNIYIELGAIASVSASVCGACGYGTAVCEYEKGNLA